MFYDNKEAFSRKVSRARTYTDARGCGGGMYMVRITQMLSLVQEGAMKTHPTRHHEKDQQLD